MKEEQLIERDSKRDLGAELLESVRQMKHKYLHKLSDGFFQTVQLFSGVGIHDFQHR